FDGLGNLVVGGFFRAARRVLALVGRIGVGGIGGAGQGVRDRDRVIVAAAGVRGILFHGLGGADHLGIGVEFFFGGLGVVVVDVRGHLHLDMAGADHRGDDGLDALAQGIFVVGGVFVLAAGERVGAGFVVTAGQKIAAIIHDGDPVGDEPGHGRGHQMLNGAHLSAIHAARGLQHDRGGGLLVVAGEDLVLGDDQMHAGGL